MTTKPLTDVKVVNGRLVRKKTYLLKKKRLAAEREVKAWEARGKK